jgi:hypothetical protein
LRDDEGIRRSWGETGRTESGVFLSVILGAVGPDEGTKVIVRDGVLVLDTPPEADQMSSEQTNVSCCASNRAPEEAEREKEIEREKGQAKAKGTLTF